MKIQYLEIVTPDVESHCAGLNKVHSVEFVGPVAALGNAHVAVLPDGSRIGIRAPMHHSEEPVVRPYFLTSDIETSVRQLEESGAQIAHPPMEIPGHGAFAIYILNNLQQGLWQN